MLIQLITFVQFASWKCSTKLEFALSWFAVVFFAIIYHAVRFLVFTIEDSMFAESPSKDISNRTGGQEDTQTNRELLGYQHMNDNVTNKDNGRETERLNPTQGVSNEVRQQNEEYRYLLLRLLHSILSGINYGIALTLMLIAMTFNPSLFLALVIGYSIGDFIFFVRMRPQSSGVDCH